MKSPPRYHFAYVFERFPSFTQTFCAREVLALRRLGVRPLVFSIHDTRGEAHGAVGSELHDQVHVLPPRPELVRQVEEWKEARLLPQSVVLTLRHWGDCQDKTRIYEAAYIGQVMRQAGVRHAHAHFAGIGARTCWWLRLFHDFTYSFTGHANDLYCPEADSPIELETLIRDAALVIAVSDHTRDWLRNAFPHSAGHIERVYNGLDPDACRPPPRADDDPAADGSDASQPLLLSVGRLIEKKGFDTLVDACRILASEGRSFRCAIVGEGPLEEALRERIRAAGLEENVRLLGPLPFSEVAGLLHDARLFVLACRTEADGGRDVLPTVIMEAMMAGVACISTRLAGIPEMIVDGVTGLLVEEADPHGLAAALARLLADPETARSMGVAGARRACELFHPSVTAARLFEFIAARGLVNPDPALLAQPAFRQLRRAFRHQHLLRLRRRLAIDRHRRFLRRHHRTGNPEAPGIVPVEVG